MTHSHSLFKSTTNLLNVVCFSALIACFVPTNSHAIEITPNMTLLELNAVSKQITSDSEKSAYRSALQARLKVASVAEKSAYSDLRQSDSSSEKEELKKKIEERKSKSKELLN